MSVNFSKKQIFIDGKSEILMCAEFHYFRSEPEKWEKVIKMIKDCGCNAIATYIPWCLHELVEGDVDLDGHSNERLNLRKYIELVQENDLYLIVRPGPFVMAELINDGIPFWLPKKYPEIVPVTWNSEKGTTVDLDYLSPNFLKETRRWYKAINGLLSEFVYPKGKIVNYQIDNEIGMLSWVSNCPPLTDVVLNDFKEYLEVNYNTTELGERYNINFDNYAEFVSKIRTPEDSYVLNLHKDLGYYLRQRTVKYVDTLKAWAKEDGILGIPFVINIHGCGGGRAFPYPIGISQLYKSYEDSTDTFSGSDIYLDNLDVPLVADWYLVNALTDSVNSSEQPLASFEFSAGDGDYGDFLGRRMETSRVDFATRMYVAQGNKMLNYYTFVGGTNYRVDIGLDNGYDRIATTGHQHGFAAPIKVDHKLSYTFERMSESIKLMVNMKDKLNSSFEDTDNVKYGFIPDYFMTEFHARSSKLDLEMNQVLNYLRGENSWETLIKGLLINGVSFKATNIQDKEIEKGNILVVPSARYMSKEIQSKLVNFLNEGGKVVLYGEVPIYDMEGNECLDLINALKLQHIEFGEKHEHGQMYSIMSQGYLEGYFEVHSRRAQVFKDLGNAEVLLKRYHDNAPCGFDVKVGNGNCIVLTCGYNTNLDMYKKIMAKLGLKQKLSHNYDRHGIFMTSTLNDDNERFIHVLNLDDMRKEFDIVLNDENIFGEKFVLNNKQAAMLPMNVKVGKATIKVANAELYSYTDNEATFRLVGENFKATFEGENLTFTSESEIKVTNENKVYKVEKATRIYGEDFITIKF